VPAIPLSEALNFAIRLAASWWRAISFYKSPSRERFHTAKTDTVEEVGEPFGLDVTSTKRCRQAGGGLRLRPAFVAASG
jgi:hypothetical protein